MEVGNKASQWRLPQAGRAHKVGCNMSLFWEGVVAAIASEAVIAASLAALIWIWIIVASRREKSSARFGSHINNKAP
jgi:hypothetical protein